MQGIPMQPNMEKPAAAPEQSPVSPEQEGTQEQQVEKAPDDTTQAQAPIIPTAVPPEKIESILSEGMDNLFLSMDVTTQAQFKAKGEETVQEIATLMQQTKVKVRQVVDLLLIWLRIIPQVNKHYLEKEAKIKAEKIMGLYKNK